MDNESRVTGWWVFAGILLGLAGFLNVVWGIAGISNSKFFTQNSVWVVSSLHTWGWITLIIGIIQLIAAFSLFSGGGFGRVIGIVAAGIGAIAALAGPAARRSGRSACSPCASPSCTSSASRPATSRRSGRGDATRRSARRGKSPGMRPP